MRVRVIPCGPFVNESERKAVETIKAGLISKANGPWVILHNLLYSADRRHQSSDIDIIVIGPTGIHVIETKHWNFEYIENPKNNALIDREANKLKNKVERIASNIRKHMEVPFLKGSFLLTRTDDPKYRAKTRRLLGSELFKLSDWPTLLKLSDPPQFSEQEIKNIATLLEPKVKLALSGDIRSFGEYTNLQLVSEKDDSFRRVYRGIHALNRDKVILYIYDYSATASSAPEKEAQREFESIKIRQKTASLPRLIESFQDAPEYPGELYYFVVADPCAPSIFERKEDENWSEEERLKIAVEFARALDELHNPPDGSDCLYHRNLSPKSMFVCSGNVPMFGELRFTKSSRLSTVVSHVDGSASISTGYCAPEVLKDGFHNAGASADIYSLCKSLLDIFPTAESNEGIVEVLSQGLNSEPSKRPTLVHIADELSKLLPKATEISSPSILDAKYWDEGHRVRFRESTYQIDTKLGVGGFGTSFRVVEIDRNGDEIGTFVAKTIHSHELAEPAINAYKRARAHSTHPNLSNIHEVAEAWKPSQIVALMEWLTGQPIADLSGILEEYADEVLETTLEDLVLDWTKQLCTGLKQLHDAGYLHGDVSPKNVILSDKEDGKVTLTDYDLLTRIGEHPIGKGTISYCSPEMESQSEIYPRDDIFSLAASLFFVAFNKSPFEFNGATRKEDGLNWQDIQKSDYPILVKFLDKATAPEPKDRFQSTAEVFRFIQSHQSPETTGNVQVIEQSRQEIPWLLELLKSYPGSRYGNSETRGLDTEFATQTYVETKLEEDLTRRILNKKTQLLILTGNAGDGKTAFLQHLCKKLGLGRSHSSQRIIEGKVGQDIRIKVNLDGSAAFKDKSSISLLDDLFAPFQNGRNPGYLAHLVAINSGPLLSWLEDYEKRHNGATLLTANLAELVQGESNSENEWLEFIDFNSRSLVGGLDKESKSISNGFLDQLIHSLLGGSNAEEIWRPCNTCTSRTKCTAFSSASMLISDSSESTVFKSRLYDAFRAVHQRGEIHITARELRAAMTYILFGTHWCRDIHDLDPGMISNSAQLTFSESSPSRQGQLLSELATYDPALESHPLIDRYLTRRASLNGEDSPRTYPSLTLSEARRKAYFDWTDNQIRQVGLSDNGLMLYAGRYLDVFLKLPISSPEEQQQTLYRVCAGLSRLVSLPTIALEQKDNIPIRITPRTPTETVFWVNKPYHQFSLDAKLPSALQGLEMLHTHLVLRYEYATGILEELQISLRLFNVLMELSEGFQISDTALDDTFANLAIFEERLAQEDQKCLFAWNPAREGEVFKIHQIFTGGRQTLSVESIQAADFNDIERILLETAK